MAHRRTDFALDQGGGRRLLAAYFPVNDPLVPLERLAAYDAAEVDVVELGVKAADPFADGKTVRAAMRRASGMGRVAEARPAIEAVRAFRHSAFGMIFGYASPAFVAEPAVWTEIDGVLCLGRKPDARTAALSDARNGGARVTEFVPYDMPSDACTAALRADGYVMLQYLPGKTGPQSGVDGPLRKRLERLRIAGVSCPILTGIGISTAGQIRHAIDAGADGVVIGSMTIQKGLLGQVALEDYLCDMREVLDGS